MSQMLALQQATQEELIRRIRYMNGEHFNTEPQVAGWADIAEEMLPLTNARQNGMTHAEFTARETGTAINELMQAGQDRTVYREDPPYHIPRRATFAGLEFSFDNITDTWNRPYRGTLLVVSAIDIISGRGEEIVRAQIMETDNQYTQEGNGDLQRNIYGFPFTHLPHLDAWETMYSGITIRVSQEAINDGTAERHVRERMRQINAGQRTVDALNNWRPDAQATTTDAQETLYQRTATANTNWYMRGDTGAIRPAEPVAVNYYAETLIETYNLLLKRFLITEEQFRGMTDLIKAEGVTPTTLELLRSLNRGEF